MADGSFPVAVVNAACKTDGCGRPWVYKNLGLCNLCYHRLRAHGVTTKIAEPGAKKADRKPRGPWGHEIDRLRRANGIAVRDLSKRVGIDHHTYARMLHRDTSVGLNYYVLLAQFLGVELSAFFPAVSVDEPTQQEQEQDLHSGPGLP